MYREADVDRGQEVINYQDIQVDHNSKVTSENKGAKLGTNNGISWLNKVRLYTVGLQWRNVTVWGGSMGTRAH